VGKKIRATVSAANELSQLSPVLRWEIKPSRYNALVLTE
jgi:hypothetical protein